MSTSNDSIAPTLFKLFSGSLIFIMQMGFCMLEAGSVRRKKITSILVKNLQNGCVAALVYWFCGFALAYGPGPRDEATGAIFSGANGNIGIGLHGLSGSIEGVWFLQYSFASAATSIVSGAVAERCSIEAYLVYVVVMASVIYPIVSCWIWNEKGWVSV